jgi:hypothetical protein
VLASRCACGERKALDINYEGDVKLLHTFGFDGATRPGRVCHFALSLAVAAIPSGFAQNPCCHQLLLLSK